VSVRRPKGYVGTKHETIGSDILAVVHALECVFPGQRLAKLPERILGSEAARQIATIKPNGWYPIALLLEMLELAHTKVGDAGLRRIGRKLFQLSHEERVVPILKSARDVCDSIDDMYHHANRGTRIGGWRVVRFDAGYAELEKTTPHLCFMEEGILSEALVAVMPGEPVFVSQTACFRSGADACTFVLHSRVQDRRWSG
jgi:predicted hydrocarbon binding protein